MFDSYETHVTPTKGVGARKHDQRTLEMLRRYFGAQRPVDSLDRRDWDGFIRDRRAGRIRPAGVEEERAGRSRTVQKNLRLLLIPIRCAWTWRTEAPCARSAPIERSGTTNWHR